MATTVIGLPQALAEIRQRDFDFTDDLPAGGSITAGTATHVPPSGAAATPVIGSPAAGIVPVKLGPLTATGVHYLDCKATYSNGEVSVIRLVFKVTY